MFDSLTVRHTSMDDIAELEAIFAKAREYMKSQGNIHQWGDIHPSMDRVVADIASGNSYSVVDRDGVVVATFALVVGEDPTYKVIYGGQWLDDAPYATIHRVASSGRVRGVGDFCFEWCKGRGITLRMDTHIDNHTMQHLAQKHGFVECGTIVVGDGSERIAYQLPL